MLTRRRLALTTLALLVTGCGALTIRLQYRVRPPTAERAGTVSFGSITDERSNPREVASDVRVRPGTPTMPQTMELMIKEGLVWAGFEVAPAPFRVDARLHTAWAHQTFYSVQANVQLSVTLVEIATDHVVWSHRFGVVESVGGADARTNHQDAYNKALTKLAGELADAFAESAFAEAMAPPHPTPPPTDAPPATDAPP